jgi:predicted kinase
VPVILVSGPQATGKTTLAMALGAALTLPVFSRDPLMAELQRGQPRWLRRLRRRSVAAAGIRLQTALLARQLELGQAAILECIAPPAARQLWRQMTAAAGSRFVSVECVCSDAAEHRARFEERQPAAQRQGAAGRQAPGQRRGAMPRRGAGWDGVLATMRRYRPDPQADFVADAVRPVADLIADIVAILGAGSDATGG